MMKRTSVFAIVVIGIFSVCSLSFDTYQPSLVDSEIKGSVPIVGTSWVQRNKPDYYFTLVFTSDHTVFQEGDYGGYGGYQYTYYYSIEGTKGEIRRYNSDNSVGLRVGEFIVTLDSEGHPSTIILTTFSMEPGDGGEQFYLFPQY